LQTLPATPCYPVVSGVIKIHILLAALCVDAIVVADVK
jgi:hypothetical protein